MYAHGFIKVVAASPKIKAGDPKTNVKEILKGLDDIIKKNPAMILYPELSLTGYSCGDLFFQEYLYRENLEALAYLLNNNPFPGILIIGTYLIKDDRLFNCAVVIQKDEILGIIPKSYLPHTQEFSENRYFVAGVDVLDDTINVFGKEIPFGQFIFTNADGLVQFGVEICEDYWEPFAPNDLLYSNGAHIVFNTSASPEVVGKAEKRSALAKVASYKNRGAYIYTSTNSSDSTSEVVFSNHKMIYEIGEIIEDVNNFNFESDYIIGDLDISRIHFMRRISSGNKNTFNRFEKLRKITYDLQISDKYEFIKPLDLDPFVPKSKQDFQKIIDIQAFSVRKRLDYIGIEKTVLGVSGGLDSTLALLSLCHMADKFKLDRKHIIGVIMPSKNTSKETYENAKALVKQLKITAMEINIDEDVNAQIKLIKHSGKPDTTYENIQARFRYYTLMNLANLHQGIVIGTSDMSEVALGWSTFNGDHMAMYGINSGLPKTVVRKVVAYYKEIYPEVADIIDNVLETPISPELASNQETEAIIGKYQVNDFILYHFLVNGDTEARIEFLLQTFFKMSAAEAHKYVTNFFDRFFKQQYKRLTMPEGAKILKLSLSPRTETKINGDVYKPNK